MQVSILLRKSMGKLLIPQCHKEESGIRNTEATNGASGQGKSFFFSLVAVNPTKSHLHVRASRGGDGAFKSLLSFQTTIPDPEQLVKRSHCPFGPSHLACSGKVESHSPVAASAPTAAGLQATRGPNQALHKGGPSLKGPISSCTKDFLSNLGRLQG